MTAGLNYNAVSVEVGLDNIPSNNVPIGYVMFSNVDYMKNHNLAYLQTEKAGLQRSR